MTDASNASTSPKPGGAWVLTLLILAGLVVGGIVGELLFRHYEGHVPAGLLEAFSFIGSTVFMGLLKMVLVPLVGSSVVVGVASIGDPAQLGRVGGWTLLYYFSTMAIAVILGVILVTALAPGDPNHDGTGIGAAIIQQGESAYAQESGSKREHIESTGKGGILGAFKNIASQMIPDNPLGAAADGQLLPVIAFSLVLGIVLTVIGPAGKPLIAVSEALFVAMMKLVEWILWLAPVGVTALVAWTVARIGLASLGGPLMIYVITVLAGLFIHGVITLPLILFVFGRTNPYVFMNRMREALMTAFGTDSSSATLPVTIECAEKLGGCSRRASRFVLPLGATINMDGTALYEAVAVVFLFQCYGIHLGPVELGIIVITATLAAVGAAGIPSAGLVTMVIVVEAVNNSLGGEKHLPLAAVGIILGIDRLLDMCRTVVNVWGDAVGAKIITRIAPDSE
ncbi:MAG: cation:dicarboxylase symporter family transporter [Planctomycetes bacterium]|nr:cation:dicarboxylase symporter family transporter [Planctomycetota bacterium]